MNLADLQPRIVQIRIESPLLGDQFPPVELPIGLITLYIWNSFADGLRMPEAPVTGMDNRGNKYRDEADADYLKKLRDYNDTILYRRVAYALAKGGNEFPGAVLFDEQVEWLKLNVAAFIIHAIHSFLLNTVLQAKAAVLETTADSFRRNGTPDASDANPAPTDAERVDDSHGQPADAAAQT